MIKILFQHKNFEILFQNENFVVCNKPCGVLSVPSRDQQDPRSSLGRDLQALLKQQIFPVHRLDVDVSGIILFALNKKAHKASQDWFLNKKISKMYLARTSLQDFSHWPENIKTEKEPLVLHIGREFFWKTKILRGKRRSFESPHGEWAETKAKIINIEENSLNWKLFPLTGKPHQLRLELSRRGFPIDGDSLYGSKIKFNAIGISLKAAGLYLNLIPDRFGLPEEIILS